MRFNLTISSGENEMVTPTMTILTNANNSDNSGDIFASNKASCNLLYALVQCTPKYSQCFHIVNQFSSHSDMMLWQERLKCIYILLIGIGCCQVTPTQDQHLRKCNSFVFATYICVQQNYGLYYLFKKVAKSTTCV